jgi:methyl-accepting chemotaxis protein
MAEENATFLPEPTKRRLPIGYQAVLGVGGLLALLVVSMLIAIGLVTSLTHDETRLNGGDVPYTDAVAAAALAAKGVANDQRGFLMTGDPAFIEEADRRVDDARTAFAAAANTAADATKLQAIIEARTGFERWVAAVRGEFTTFRAGEHQAAITASFGPDRELRKTYEQSLAKAQSLGDSSIQAARSSVVAAESRTVQALWVCLILAVAIGVSVGFWLVRSVALPLFRLVALLIPDLPG